MEQPPDGFKRYFRNRIGPVKHVLPDPRPPIGNPVEQADIILAQRDQIIARQDTTQSLGDGEAEIVAGRVEAAVDFLVGAGDEPGEVVGGDGGEYGERGGGDVGVGEVEVAADAGADGLPEVGGEAGGADEVEGELLAHGGGRGGDDLLDGGLGDDGDVAAGGGVLERLEEGAGLAEGVVGAEVGLDLGEDDVHRRRRSERFDSAPHSLRTKRAESVATARDRGRRA